MEKIKNISKEKFKSIRKLHQKKFRKAGESFIVEGLKLIEEAIKSDWVVETVLMTKYLIEKPKFHKFLNYLLKITSNVYEISQKELGEITDTVTSQGIAAVVKPKIFNIDKSDIFSRNKSLIVTLDKVTDAGNLGTIIRTCDWFGVDCIIMGNNTVDLYNPKVVRSTMGSLFHIPIFSDVDLENFLKNLKKLGYIIYSTVLNGESLNDVVFAPKTVLVFGSESHGVSESIDKISDAKITINKFGNSESLNVAVACGIVLAACKNY